MTLPSAPSTPPHSSAPGTPTYASCGGRDQSVNVKSGRVEGVSLGETEGFGVRVLVDGAWGFASSGRMDGPEVDRVAALAVRIARASAGTLVIPSCSPTARPRRAATQTPVEEDPFEVPVDRTVDLLLEAERAMAAVNGHDHHAGRLSGLP